MAKGRVFVWCLDPREGALWGAFDGGVTAVIAATCDKSVAIVESLTILSLPLLWSRKWWESIEVRNVSLTAVVSAL